ncbi:galanin receptor 2a-like [Diadema setosum]|uniref:galanin receptor 2a-like n=1 Tax=Diadema setosum TaxID=31175 RepID=UPI003B3AC3B6
MRIMILLGAFFLQLVVPMAHALEGSGNSTIPTELPVASDITATIGLFESTYSAKSPPATEMQTSDIMHVQQPTRAENHSTVFLGVVEATDEPDGSPTSPEISGSGEYSDLYSVDEESSLNLPDWAWKPLIWHWYLILQLLSGIIGIIGNLLVILVLFQRRAACRSTDTLVNGLAIADLLTSVFVIPIPHETRVPMSWLSEIYCKVINTSFCLWVSVMASTYLLMAISVERYIAVAYPLHFSRLLTKRRVSIAIAIIWAWAFLSTSWSFIVEIVDPVSRKCKFVLATEYSSYILGSYWFIIRLVLPMFVMVLTQTLIARELHRQSLRFKNDKESGTTKTPHLIARNRVLKMMFEVILIFIICWAPNLTAYLGYVFGFVPRSYSGSALHHSLTVLGFYNSCANPFIYTARHPQFREALKGIFTGKTDGNAPLFEQKMDSQSGNSKSMIDRTDKSVINKA